MKGEGSAGSQVQMEGEGGVSWESGTNGGGGGSAGSLVQMEGEGGVSWESGTNGGGGGSAGSQVQMEGYLGHCEGGGGVNFMPLPCGGPHYPPSPEYVS